MSPTFDPTLSPPLLKTTSIWEHFCDGPELNASCDKYFNSNNFTEINGIPGLASGIITGKSWQVICSPGRSGAPLQSKLDKVSQHWACLSLSTVHREPVEPLPQQRRRCRERLPVVLQCRPPSINSPSLRFCWHHHLLHTVGGHLLPLSHRYKTFSVGLIRFCSLFTLWVLTNTRF